MSEQIKYVSDASFEADVLKSDKPVLVDFWACLHHRHVRTHVRPVSRYKGRRRISPDLLVGRYMGENVPTCPIMSFT